MAMDTFWTQDAEMILAMPLGPKMEDERAWFGDQKGDLFGRLNQHGKFRDVL